MNEAVSRFVDDGDSVAMGTALEAAMPFAVEMHTKSRENETSDTI